MPRQRPLKLELETVITLAGTLLSAMLLILTAVYAGPLWRDETGAANVAAMSFQEIWSFPYESFPPCYHLLLHACHLAGLASTDIQFRILGIYVGLFVLGSLWLSARWMGCRGPSISIGLMGFLPLFIFIMGANRAYGPASGLLILSFGTLWRMVEQPSPLRILAAAAACFLFAHCVYYDVVFLAAMLGGGALVACRRHQWKTLAALTGIGAVSAGSLAVYWPIILIHRSGHYAKVSLWPFFNSHVLWWKLRDSVTARASSQSGRPDDTIWLWIALFLAGLFVAARLQRGTRATAPATNPAWAEPRRADLALFCATSLLLGLLGYLAFLLHLGFLTQNWYYVEMLCLCATSLDGLLGASGPALRPWGWARIALLAGLLGWYGQAAWTEAHTRRSNLDLIANMLEKQASASDLIVVDTAWEGIAFNRYYHGAAPWVTIPPMNSHLVHRSDLMFESMQQLDVMAPVLLAATNTLQAGHVVWLVGDLTEKAPVPPPPLNAPRAWLGTYINFWEEQLSFVLIHHAAEKKSFQITTGQPVFWLEDETVVRCVGYQAGE